MYQYKIHLRFRNKHFRSKTKMRPSSYIFKYQLVPVIVITSSALFQGFITSVSKGLGVNRGYRNIVVRGGEVMSISITTITL